MQADRQPAGLPLLANRLINPIGMPLRNTLPAAEHYLRDYRPARDFPRYVGLWSREAVAAALQRLRG